MLDFIKTGVKSYDVLVDGLAAGTLFFDKDQNAYIFNWGDDGVTYEKSLKDTKKLLEQEFENGKKENFEYFGQYKY